MITEGKKEIMVALETGHGKTLVIQLIADMLLRMVSSKVIIVCLNNFLANWAKATLGKNNQYAI
jgi:superfamily II DNA or RNA helicase